VAISSQCFNLLVNQVKDFALIAVAGSVIIEILRAEIVTNRPPVRQPAVHTLTAIVEIMAPKNRKFRTTHSPANHVKTAILLDLLALKQERKSRLKTLLGRFLECQELQMSSALVAKAVEQCSRWRVGRRLLPPGGSLPPTS
jgi:hypothetical protein